MQPHTRLRAAAVYVSNADSGTVSVLSLDAASGALHTLQTVELGGMIMPLALSPDRRRLFAARRSEPLAAVTLAVDAAAGTLARVGEGPLPDSMAYIATDRSGRWLLAASYGGHRVSVSRVGDDGIVQLAHQVLATGRHAHAIRTDAGNRFAFSTSLGDGHVAQWRFDADAGELRPNDPPQLALRAASGPRHLELHPNGRVAYLLNELDASLDVLALDPSSGTLQWLRTLDTRPPGFYGTPWAADLHLTPDARFLYTSERRSSFVTGFALDAAGLAPTPVGHWPVPDQPRGFHVTSDGRWMIVAGQTADRVALLAIGEDGQLVPHAEHAVGRNPNWVETLALG